MDVLAEQTRLDQAMERIDPMLAESLRREQRQRRLRFLAVLMGGATMLTTAAIVAGLVVGTQWGVDPTTGATPPRAVSADAIQKAQERQQAGWTLWQERRYTEAEAAFAEAVALDPNASNAWNGLGWSRFNAGQREPAIAAFEKAVALEPKHPAALNGLGQTYQAMGDLEKSERYLLEAAPAAPAAHWGLARLYLLREDFDRALPWTILINQQGADPVAKRMFDAAVAHKLPEDLRREIAPATLVNKPAPAKKTPADDAHAQR